MGLRMLEQSFKQAGKLRLVCHLSIGRITATDIFRGDDVRLDYPFNHMPMTQLDGAIIESGLRKGEKVYLSLTTDGVWISHGEQLHATAPQGPYLKGYVTSHWPYRHFVKANKEERKALVDAWPVAVKYGIELYYCAAG